MRLMRLTKCGERKTSKVALTFDDGPNPFFTGQFLEILKTEGCIASFFLIGRFAERYPELVRRIRSEGHTIGGHTYTHGGDDDQQTFGDFRKGNDVIEGIIGEAVKYIRVPGFGYGEGRCSELFGNLSDKIQTGELVVVDQDDVILNDWMYDAVTPDEICTQVREKCKNGSIISLHDGSHREREMNFRPEKTLQALTRIIRDLRERGFQMVNLDSLSLEFQGILVSN
jgi:peptidoglycan/xylan/chitin deacetylase (PgdA/CDA1 family)